MLLIMDVLEKHIRSCRIDGCGCRTFYKCYKSWSAKLPVVAGADVDDTWLWFDIDDQSKFRWMCVACHGGAYLQGLRQPRTDDNPQMPKLSHLLVHHDSALHQANVAKMLGNESVASYVVPPKQLFLELFHAFQAGAAPTGGYKLPSGRLAVVKANNMLWCIDQGLVDIRLDVFGTCGDHKHSER